MENTPSDLPANAVSAHCPYLGLHDDRFTSLAFSSNWNFCYRAKPPSSIDLSHQTEFCLGSQYVQCPIYLRAKAGPLPSALRGSARLPNSGGRLGLMLLLLLLIILAAGLFFRTRLLEMIHNGGFGLASPQVLVIDTQFPLLTQTPRTIETVLASWTNPALIIPTALPSNTPTVNLTETTATLTATNTLTLTPSKTPTRTPSTTPSGTCGHNLDVTFGSNPVFVIHQLERGDNLNMLAPKYQTTPNAILAVNYHLSMPVQPGWFIVIPVGTSNVTNVPPFEPYQAPGVVITTDEMARQLGTDPRLLSQYNAFVEPCKLFLGWMIVPRIQGTATP
jgi:LysM repeat protein